MPIYSFVCSDIGPTLRRMEVSEGLSSGYVNNVAAALELVEKGSEMTLARRRFSMKRAVIILIVPGVF